MSFEVITVGIFKGSSYVITHIDDGRYNWYCGYVEVPKNHIYFEQHYDDINDIECHGGLTYSGYRFRDGAYYIGFDTNHFDSEPCNNVVFVENECLNIIDQLIKLNN
ncbi:hypothetical protein [Fusobacterium periodonticum]|uniref:Uncharacterized protein n=1 Tax=Fusobacterium periodonticum ATCC 33693 TaxID=546275 RepID=D4CXA0_9FUSO|nr:hypothetical protein [Fusobacterium periodonticum]EFE86020.1 hypothetical protein FUSPEROL_02061 [Fusobacterium periodonticum ATCC 33693]